MTSNQLIALLETYRTGDPTRSGLGTVIDDVKFLKRAALIEEDGNRWRVTDKAHALVEVLLDVCCLTIGGRRHRL